MQMIHFFSKTDLWYSIVIHGNMPIILIITGEKMSSLRVGSRQEPPLYVFERKESKHNITEFYLVLVEKQGQRDQKTHWK